MKTATEIRNALENLKYYSGQLHKLVKQQFDIDAAMPEMNTVPGSVRFDALGAIASACGWLDVYCDNMEANLKVAEAQDKELTLVEEKQ